MSRPVAVVAAALVLASTPVSAGAGEPASRADDPALEGERVLAAVIGTPVATTASALLARAEAPAGGREPRWVSDYLPVWLLQPGALGLSWWQWLALPLLVLAAWGLGYVLAKVTGAVLRHLARRTAVTWDDELVHRSSGPLTFAWALGALYIVLPELGLQGANEQLLTRTLRVGFFVVFFWALWRQVSLAGSVLTQTAWAKGRPASAALIPLAARVTKVVVLAMAVIAIIDELGFPVASLIAGLGIGGLALALAAQKTVENLFGAFSIGVDQPFREGDFVRVEDFVGTVEAIGLRSTRIRTLDRTIISLPNGKLAEMRVETFAARDRIRLWCVLGLVYGTTARQMREVIAGIEALLREHPKIWPDAIVVRFKEFGESSLDVEVMAWFTTSDWNEFTAIRQEVLLGFMELVERAGSSFAYPTRTVHLVGARPHADE